MTVPIERPGKLAQWLEATAPALGFTRVDIVPEFVMIPESLILDTLQLIDVLHLVGIA
ncbi:hypothetical protein [Halorubrum sp. 48-1-W]|uniref:hypothetical protein n=1 Tax=Halorubrum sp. 48-1-W TaxID=2249761 RepID=UPI001300729C|nr:hypothetical protein [Halorubrum sp. 48-1-W]